MTFIESVGYFVSTFFCVGFFSIISSGFTASVISIPMVWFLHTRSLIWQMLIIAICFAIGCWSSGVTAFFTNDRDPSIVVIDEVCGMLFSGFVVAVCMKVFQLPQLGGLYDKHDNKKIAIRMQTVVISFFMFIMLDSIKSYPICLMEELSGGLGIMMDDMFAALFAGLFTFVFISLIKMIGDKWHMR